MAIEATVLHENEITYLLKEKYSIRRVDEITRLDGGTANCRLIVCEKGKLILKELPTYFTAVQVEPEPEINCFLRKQEIPVAEFYPINDGGYVWTFRDRVFHLQEFVDGAILERNTAPGWFLHEAPVLLGRIHRVLERWPRLNDGMGKDYFSSWSMEQAIANYDESLRLAEKEPDLLVRERMLADLNYKKSRLGDVERVAPDYQRLTYKNTHGDYKNYNVICGESRINAVIDFSGACYHPVIWEIIRSYVHADPICRDGSFSIQNLREYTALYLAQVPLNAYDLEMMADLFYYQHLRANYYREYFYGHESHKKGALDVARWSTDICRWLEAHKGEMMTGLLELVT